MNITPKGKQKEVLALPSTGHTVVLGTAGSGKTTIALLRAYHLAALPGNKKVLLVTFNGALVEYIKGISDVIPRNLTVENYHKFARGYLHSRGKMPPRNGILNSDSKAYYISLAKKSLQEQYPTESTLARSDDFFVDEITFIEKFGFTDLDTYNQAERIGRASANIKRENRKWVFAVYEKYIELRKTAGHEYDWDDLALYVYLELQNDQTPRRYTHIIVDEGLGNDDTALAVQFTLGRVGEEHVHLGRLAAGQGGHLFRQGIPAGLGIDVQAVVAAHRQIEGAAQLCAELGGDEHAALAVDGMVIPTGHADHGPHLSSISLWFYSFLLHFAPLCVLV